MKEKDRTKLEKKITLKHECPNFWFASTALSEEELSWAAYKIYKIVDVSK